MGWFRKLKRHLPWNADKKTVTVVRMEGVLTSSQGRNHLNLAGLADALEEAFSYPDRAAVALVINSPGGSPVQSSLIAKRIRQLAERENVPVYAFAEDAAASGGYWLACSADHFYVDDASIIGSIGVISSGFGFDRFIDQHKIDRRVHTAGVKKAQLDPFQPESEEDLEKLGSLLERMHKIFKDYVRSRRGDKIKKEEDELFTGEFWTGQEAVELGLADEVGDLRSVLQDKFGKDVKIEAIDQSKGLFSIFSSGGFGANLGSAIVDRFVSRVETRSLWQRLGL